MSKKPKKNKMTEKKEGNYFTFPLSVLLAMHNGKPTDSTPSIVIYEAMACGIMSAGIGYREKHGVEAYENYVRMLGYDVCGDTTDEHGLAAAGYAVCGLEVPDQERLDLVIETYAQYDGQDHQFPLVRMRKDLLFSAGQQADYDAGETCREPSRGISWIEFRILCAILSGKTNYYGFTFMGWETIQARSCGLMKKRFKLNDRVTPSHLCPPYTHAQIRKRCDKLEQLGFYARCRHSKGTRGGLMAYSFAHSPEELRKDVSKWAAFHRGDALKESRKADMEFSIKAGCDG